MERERKRSAGSRYHARMKRGDAVAHPIDHEIRARLRILNLAQKDLAKAIGRSAGWVNKYFNGAGHATIDDLIRIFAFVVEVHGLTTNERRLLRAWKRIPAKSQVDAVEFFEIWVRQQVRRDRETRRRSTARSARTTRETDGKGPGPR